MLAAPRTSSAAFLTAEKQVQRQGWALREHMHRVQELGKIHSEHVWETHIMSYQFKDGEKQMQNLHRNLGVERMGGEEEG